MCCSSYDIKVKCYLLRWTCSGTRGWGHTGGLPYRSAWFVFILIFHLSGTPGPDVLLCSVVFKTGGIAWFRELKRFVLLALLIELYSDILNLHIYYRYVWRFGKHLIEKAKHSTFRSVGGSKYCVPVTAWQRDPYSGRTRLLLPVQRQPRATTPQPKPKPHHLQRLCMCAI